MFVVICVEFKQIAIHLHLDTHTHIYDWKGNDIFFEGLISMQVILSYSKM